MAKNDTFFLRVTWTKVTFQLERSRIGNILAWVKRSWGPFTAELEKSGQESIKAVKTPLVMQVFVRKATSAAKPVTCHLCSKELPSGKPMLLPSGWTLVKPKKRTRPLSGVEKKSIYKVEDGRVEKLYLDRLILNPGIKFKVAKHPDYEMHLCSDCGDKYLRSENAASSVNPSSNPLKTSLLTLSK